jgi:ATP-binding cassette subfamily B protein
LNGQPLERYLKKEWRQAFHLLLQGAQLYQDFARDNLLYGEPPRRWKATASSFEHATKIAGADALLRELPSGEKTFLGDWAAPPGVTPHKVSGGQIQRLLIARSLIHGGRFLGFDEPTSAMDAVAETSFFERLHAGLRHKGLIFISHRFSTVRRASRLLVFHEGRLMQDGTHESLLRAKGPYATLYREQAKWYE